MAPSKSNANLILPKRTGKITSHHDITLESVTKWRQYHADSGVTATATDLYKMLQDMHQTSLSAKERFDMLQVLKPTLAFLCHELEKLYNRQEVLPDHLKQIADLAYTLNVEMLNGYKLVIHDSLRPLFANKKLLVAALANAMHFSIKILFYTFEQHRQPQQNSWYELHSLYLFGMKHDLLTTPINHSYSHSRFENILDMYKHALLFATANPHRLRKEELAHLIYAMDTWSAHLTLLPAKKTRTPTLFIVDLKSDTGPKYSELYPEPTESCYYLDMHWITDHLAQLIPYQPPPEKIEKDTLFTSWELSLPKPFVATLLKTWQQIGERQYHREATRGFVNVAVGISSCFHYLDKSTQDAHPVYTCELIDKSERGYGLKWMQDIPPQLICGEIIGMEHEKEWELGTIRWLKHEEDNSLLIGVQLLSRHGIPVKAQSVQHPAMMRTLLIPGLGTQDRHKSDMLITPTLHFKAGQTISIILGEKTYEAKLEKGITQTPSFQLFPLTYVGDPVQISLE